MSGAEVLDVGRDALWLTLQLCAPCLIVGLVVGGAIGLPMAGGYYYATQSRERGARINDQAA